MKRGDHDDGADGRPFSPDALDRIGTAVVAALLLSRTPEGDQWYAWLTDGRGEAQDYKVDLKVQPDGAIELSAPGLPTLRLTETAIGGLRDLLDVPDAARPL